MSLWHGVLVLGMAQLPEEKAVSSPGVAAKLAEMA